MKFTTDDGLHEVIAEQVPAIVSIKNPPADGPRALKVDSKRKSRPRSILELIEFSYGEAGRKLNLARKDLDSLSVNKDVMPEEIAAVRRLAPADPMLAVPLSLLAALAELGAKHSVLLRLLQLVEVAFASHPLFEGRIEQLHDPRALPGLTAEEVNEAVTKLNLKGLCQQTSVEASETDLKRLRVNAVTGLGLFRVLRDGWTSKQFIADMAAFVWDSPPQESTSKTAALLATSKSTEALAQLSRHFEGAIRDAQRATATARAHAAHQEHRAAAAEAHCQGLSAELEIEKQRSNKLLVQVDDLTRLLTAEQSSRVVDKSHLVDDYEALRTQVIRRLTDQVGLLSDGLHAIRNGSTGVAEEFVDRALTAIDGEVTHLKDLDGGVQ
ncbi:hypothetical protein [Arthrobacter sp. zg-Y1171]|uniref:hypothetical protein n=1 Tax=Arthrobacter sp. zg-Y1171 TaxID=2964610 RepID=UPI0021039BE0|nr:hypothetical protein [Arthrobacter sp. zg-Y1171]MCQ1995277.1 hypothetical protein [Arthrobacter sp. zg-Y1171]UWX80684.1 hypothetical protein N2L00_09555 [Arthrobacter sp. zg-Y1171]